MNKTIDYLKGKKTIGTAVIALVYVAGAWLGWYPLDEKVLVGFGAAGLVFLRLGIANAVGKAIDQKLPMVFLIGGLALSLCGCAGTKAQHVALATTDALGQAVNEARDAFAAYEVQQAKVALAEGKVLPVTPDDISAWVFAQPEYKRADDMLQKFNRAYTAWCLANAAAAAGTNASQVFGNADARGDMLSAAADFTQFVAQFVPALKTIIQK